MNYRHAYHAGNFADVFKHIVLVALTKSFLHKESAFCYLDTHAGTGHYDLQSPPAQKSKEFKNGIVKIAEQNNPPDLVKSYLSSIQLANTTAIDTLRYYPGSPCFVRHLLRPQDRMIVCELHEEDWQQLKKTFPHDKQVAIHHRDGYEALKAFLPPKERRGLVLIDPPYENADEFSTILSALPAAVSRWETGVFALWYPIKERRSTERFLHSLKQKIERPLLAVELSIYPDNTAASLNGNGLVIVNPPWQFNEEIKSIMPWLWHTLSPNKQGRYETRELT